MPAIVAPQASGRTTANQTDTQKTRAAAPAKKRRVTRRRGRARGELDSDDEIEREAATDDSETEDNLSDNSSVTDDSDTEPASEDVIPHDRTHLPTPRNSKSPESLVKGDASSFFTSGATWSEMVDEGANEAGELPVVDFAEFGTKPLPPTKPPTRKAKKAAAKAKKVEPSPAPLPEPSKPIEDPAPPPADRADESSATATDAKQPHPPSKRPPPGNSARQIYQQKLESDPSYVPTIGNFWGHDDRLIDTELRSLSGWWRGRGGRGRGRGGFVGRGRGGFNGFGGGNGDMQSPADDNLPAVERAWTHDGFEEMKKRDEHRRAEQATARQAQALAKRGSVGRGGRGGLVPGRGRGRGGFNSPIIGRNNFPANHYRFAMKPELMWTKQHEAFLYFDSTMKPRAGQGAGFRIRLPGKPETSVVRAPQTSAPRLGPSTSTPPTQELESAVVRLPKRSDKVKLVATEPSTTKPSTNDLSAAKSGLVTESAPLPAPEETPATRPPLQPIRTVSEPVIVTQLSKATLESTVPHADPEAQIEQIVLQDQPSESDVVDEIPEPTSTTERPVLPPLQTTFTPPPPPPQPMAQPSPAYGSPYGFPVPLPPGIAMNAHGMPYEVATGRPVYLQPPQSMYNPQPPMMHYSHPSMSFHPGHMHHPSVSTASPDFLAPPSQTPPVNGFIDPATGTPIFAFPRQTTRVEIRAPANPPSAIDAPKSSSSKASVPRTPSGLRTTAPTFQPQPTRPVNYYQPSSTPSESSIPPYDPHAQSAPPAGHAHSASMEDPAASMGGAVMQPYPYPHPQQAYYYPEPYGYPQYMDMSHAGQAYDMYGMDQTPQGTVYY